MDKTRFGKTDLRISRLGFGGAPVGYLGTQQQQITDILNGLLDRGVNLIDTAECYPGSEEAIGQAVSHRREEYVLVTKCGHTPKGLSGSDWDPQMIAASIDLSLKRLRTDRLDAVLLHSCPLEMLKRGEVLAAVVKAREAGKVRFAGYSGDNEAAAYAATLPDVAVIETSINITDQANIDTVLPACVRHDVGVLAKRPIANAAWKPLDTQPGIYSGYAATYSERFGKMGVSPEELGFAGEANWPEIALRFTLSQPGVSCAIIGTTSPRHAEANIAAASEGPLAGEAVAQLRAAFRRAERAVGAAWTGQT